MTPAHPLKSLRSAATADAGRPCVVWHGEAGRIELSAASLWNYAVKAANLFTQECAVRPGGAVRLLLPAHWQSLGLVLGTWLAGAHVTQSESADITVALDTDSDQRGADAITSLDAWGRPSEHLNTSAALDLGRDLRAQPDVLLEPTAVDMTVVASQSDSESKTFVDLVTATRELPKRVGLIVQPQIMQLPAALPALATHAANGGCVVICPAAARDDVARQERVEMWM